MTASKTLALLALSLAAAGQEKRMFPPPPSMRTFTQSCESIRPVAARIATKNGWRVDASQKSGPIQTSTGIIWFAVGDGDCDVYVSHRDQRVEQSILAAIAEQVK